MGQRLEYEVVVKQALRVRSSLLTLLSGQRRIGKALNVEMAVVEKRIAVSRKRRKRAARLTPEADRRGGVIEIEAGGMTVRIGRGVDAKLATAVIMALKAAK